jgi:hypothetical protein
MDHSIRPVTPQIMRERGAQAYDMGLGINDHHMNPSALAIADWQAGWMERRAQIMDRLLVAAVGSHP